MQCIHWVSVRTVTRLTACGFEILRSSHLYDQRLFHAFHSLLLGHQGVSGMVTQSTRICIPHQKIKISIGANMLNVVFKRKTTYSHIRSQPCVCAPYLPWLLLDIVICMQNESSQLSWTSKKNSIWCFLLSSKGIHRAFFNSLQVSLFEGAHKQIRYNKSNFWQLVGAMMCYRRICAQQAKIFYGTWKLLYFFEKISKGRKIILSEWCLHFCSWYGVKLFRWLEMGGG